MSEDHLLKAKRELYYQLLRKDYKDYTAGEIEMLSALASDRDIQAHLEKHRQSEHPLQTE
ncbi:MAG: hypothetical protein KAX16_07325 [Actinomycetia bacterium]|nr:hypothetical protein [Actinomycetes bacterium]